MSSGTVLIWGVTSIILLIGSCLVLNAQTYYQELENKFLIDNNMPLKISSQLVLRDRTHELEKVKQNE